MGGSRGERQLLDTVKHYKMSRLRLKRGSADLATTTRDDASEHSHQPHLPLRTLPLQLQRTSLAANDPHRRDPKLPACAAPPPSPTALALLERFACVHCHASLARMSKRRRVAHVRACDLNLKRSQPQPSGAPVLVCAAVAVEEEPPAEALAVPENDPPSEAPAAIPRDPALAPPTEAQAAALSDPAVAAAPSNALVAMMQASRRAAAPPEPVDAFQRMLRASAALGGGLAPDDGPSKARHSPQTRWRDGRQTGPRRLAWHKRIVDTPYVVDGFQAPSEGQLVYFLSHFHADHYVGLTRHWSAPIYCSPITARLVYRRLRVRSELLRHIHVGERIRLPGGHVEAIDANHCPGALLLLFTLDDGRIVLHTGDFRYTPSMASSPPLATALAGGRRLSLLYLDNTYLEPRHTFPTQQAVIDRVVEECRVLAQCRKTLVLFGAYSIGKERVFVAAAEACNQRLHVSRERLETLSCLNFPPEVVARFTSDPTAARWAVVPMNHLRFDRMRERLRESRGRFTSCVAFKPTGWTAGRMGKAGSNLLKVSRSGALTINEVAYSEHSSFEELRGCVRDLRPEKTIFTVGGGNRGGQSAAAERARMHHLLYRE